MNYHFAYLVGALLFDAAWLACYLIGKKYRAQVIWGTVISAPLAITSILFIPQYWTPPSLFDPTHVSAWASKISYGPAPSAACFGRWRNCPQRKTCRAQEAAAP